MRNVPTKRAEEKRIERKPQFPNEDRAALTTSARGFQTYEQNARPHDICAKLSNLVHGRCNFQATQGPTSIVVCGAKFSARCIRSSRFCLRRRRQYSKKPRRLQPALTSP